MLFRSRVFETIRSLCPSTVYSVAGEKPLLTQAAIIESAGLCISNDSGLMHLSAALPEVKVIAIFGPTKPDETSPFGKGHVVLHHTVDCWPCRYRRCPLDHSCMKAISPEEVMDAVERVIGKR